MGLLGGLPMMPAAQPLLTEPSPGLLTTNQTLARQFAKQRAANPRPDVTDFMGYGPDWQSYLQNFGNNISQNFPIGSADEVKQAAMRMAMSNGPGMIAGPGAKTANLAKLESAKSLEAAGKSREEIWGATGWYKGPEGKWKFEIDDSKAFIKANEIQPHLDYPEVGISDLGTAVRHPALFDAYPQIKSYALEMNPNINTKGSFGMFGDGIGGGSIQVQAGSPQHIRGMQRDGMRQAELNWQEWAKADHAAGDFKTLEEAQAWHKAALEQDRKTLASRPVYGDRERSTLLHEMQHAIQQQEGFSRGGSAAEFTRGYKSIVKDANDQIEAINAQLSKAAGTPRYYELMQMRQELVNEIQRIEGKHGIGASERGNNDYRRLAGEAEARAVQARMSMTPEQRMQTPPWTSYDVPWEQLITK